MKTKYSAPATLTILVDTVAFGRQWITAIVAVEPCIIVQPKGSIMRRDGFVVEPNGDECLIFTNPDKSLRVKGTEEYIRGVINTALEGSNDAA